jgi:hypothetical protein
MTLVIETEKKKTQKINLDETSLYACNKRNLKLRR